LLCPDTIILFPFCINTITRTQICFSSLPMLILSQFYFCYYWPNNSHICVIPALFICGMPTTFHARHVCCVPFLFSHEAWNTLLLISDCLVTILFMPFKFRSFTFPKARFMHNASMLGSHYYSLYMQVCWFTHKTITWLLPST
jgi:hypothetical protein